MRAPACFDSRGRARPGFSIVLAAVLLSCAEKKPPAPLDEAPDSGPSCERGSANCSCTSSGRCDSPLLCIAGRCLASDSEPDPPDPPITRPPVIRPPSGSDGGDTVPDAPPDAAPDGAAPAGDASLPGDELDASPG